MNLPQIQKLADIFSKFPTIGQRTASRFVFYLINLSDSEFNDFLSALKELKEKTKTCSFCFNPFESLKQEKFCPICSDNSRIKSIICIVEKESDLNAIERTKKYNGLYFILGGTIPLNKNKNTEVRMEKLEKIIRKVKSLKEIITAFNFTTEGESTALYLERKIKSINPDIKITCPRRGLPLGGEIEYADSETLGTALEERK